MITDIIDLLEGVYVTIAIQRAGNKSQIAFSVSDKANLEHGVFCTHRVTLHFIGNRLDIANYFTIARDDSERVLFAKSDDTPGVRRPVNKDDKETYQIFIKKAALFLQRGEKGLDPNAI